MVRPSRIIAYFTVSLVAIFACPVLAADSVPIHWGSTELSSGRTLVLADQAKIGIFPNALTAETDVSWKMLEADVPALPADQRVSGHVYQLTVVGASNWTAGVDRPAAVSLPIAESEWRQSIWQYDTETKGWTELPTKIRTSKKIAQAPARTTNGYYTVLEDHTFQSGQASWYCRVSCSSHYPKYHGTSNDFSVGSKVRVRNLENGKSVEIEIVSGWGKPPGRVVDLSWPAFAMLKSSNEGLARVTVEKVGVEEAIPKKTVATIKTKKEIIPTLKVTATNKKSVPVVSATAYQIIDVGSKSVLAEFNADQPRSIASITKLMTVMVVIDQGWNLKKVVTYTTKDNAECSCLRLSNGETLTVRDLFYATLVGSANNAANALARSTGLSWAEFVTKMNDKAKAIGLTNTTFTDPSGLGAGNVSTAADIAIMADYAYKNYEPIRYATTRRSYSFSTINTNKPHTIYLRYSLVGDKTISGGTVTGAKTGFTNEAMNTYAIRVKNRQGAQIVVTIFGEPSWAKRNADTAALINWALQSHTWS